MPSFPQHRNLKSSRRESNQHSSSQAESKPNDDLSDLVILINLLWFKIFSYIFFPNFLQLNLPKRNRMD